MAADLGLVLHAAQRDAPEVAAQRAGDAASERGLADAGRADEAQDGALAVRLELAHGQVLEDPLLDRLEAMVVLVEHVLRPTEAGGVQRGLGPGQVADRFQPGADHAVLGAIDVHAAQALDLALGLLTHLVGHAGRVDALLEGVGLGVEPGGVPELLADGLELLAELVLALALVHRRLDLGADLGVHAVAGERAGDVVGDPEQAGLGRDLRHQRETLLPGHVELAVELVGEAVRVARIGHQELAILLAHAGLGEQLLVQPGDLVGGGAHLDRIIAGLGHGLHVDDGHVVLEADGSAHGDALDALHEHLQAAVGQAGCSADPAGHAHLGQAGLGRVVDVGVQLGHRDQLGLGVQVVFHRGEAGGTTDWHGPKCARKQDHPSEGQRGDGEVHECSGRPGWGGRYPFGGAASRGTSAVTGSLTSMGSSCRCAAGPWSARAGSCSGSCARTW